MVVKGMVGSWIGAGSVSILVGIGRRVSCLEANSAFSYDFDPPFAARPSIRFRISLVVMSPLLLNKVESLRISMISAGT